MKNICSKILTILLLYILDIKTSINVTVLVLYVIKYDKVETEINRSVKKHYLLLPYHAFTRSLRLPVTCLNFIFLSARSQIETEGNTNRYRAFAH